MIPVVLDASAAGALLLPDEGGAMKELVENVLRHHIVHAPAHWPTELASLIVNAVRRKRIDPVEAHQICMIADTLRSLVTVADTAPIPAIASLAFDTRLSACDAAYAVLAKTLGARLLTGDRRLNEAARAMGIDVIA